MKFALPYLISRGGGTIISTGSYLAIRGEAACGPYGASKHAVVGLTKTLAVESAIENVRANVVCPGSMDTRMIRQLFSGILGRPRGGGGSSSQGNSSETLRPSVGIGRDWGLASS